MRLSELKKGQVWMLEHPRRIVRIGEPTTIEIQVMKSMGGGHVPDIENVPAVRVAVTMPDRAIEGFQSEEDAEMIAELVQGVLRSPDRIKGARWDEVWAERAVHKIQTPVGSAAKELRAQEMQLYCAESHGRQQKQDRSSPVVNGPISGKLIPAELVPADQFEVRKLLRPGRKCAGCQEPLEAVAQGTLCANCRAAIEMANEPAPARPKAKQKKRTAKRSKPKPKATPSLQEQFEPDIEPVTADVEG